LKPDTPDCMVRWRVYRERAMKTPGKSAAAFGFVACSTPPTVCFAFARGRRLGRRLEAVHDPKGTAVVAIGTTEQSSISDVTHIVTFATFVTEGSPVQRILTHIGEPAQAPSIATRRGRFGAGPPPGIATPVESGACLSAGSDEASCQILCQCAVWRWTCSAPSTCYGYW